MNLDKFEWMDHVVGVVMIALGMHGITTALRDRRKSSEPDTLEVYETTSDYIPIIEYSEIRSDENCGTVQVRSCTAHFETLLVLALWLFFAPLFLCYLAQASNAHCIFK